MLAPLTIPFVIALGLAADEKPFVLRTGDRIVLLGDTLIERDQTHGYLETALLSRFPSRKLRFRNLGWSADTVEGLSRVYFDSAEKGKERLHEQAKGEKPTVLLIGYGMAESLENPANSTPFSKRLASLLDVIAKDAENVVLISPIRHEDMAPPFPDAAAHNHVLVDHVESIRLLANDRRFPFVDLFHGLSSMQREYSLSNLTDNGIHLNRLGYWLFAQEFQRSLGMKEEAITASLDAKGSVLSQEGCVISNVQATASGLQFDQLDVRLPTCITGVPEDAWLLPGVVRPALCVTGLPTGNYRLAIDDREIARASRRGMADRSFSLEHAPA
ncbi:MAG: SGNH/GDSL hydrolase family protein [Planctomycetota bacterium]